MPALAVKKLCVTATLSPTTTVPTIVGVLSEEAGAVIRLGVGEPAQTVNPCLVMIEVGAGVGHRVVAAGGQRALRNGVAADVLTRHSANAQGVGTLQRTRRDLVGERRVGGPVDLRLTRIGGHRDRPGR